jgi:hypothetical protein
LERRGFKLSIEPLEQTALPENPDFINDIVLQWVIISFVMSKGTIYRIHATDSELNDIPL